MSLQPLSVEEYRARVGSEVGLSEWIRIDQKCIDRFAELTRDSQYIHVDPERAKASVFGGTIAHGYLTLSFLSAMVAMAVPPIEGTTTGINYGFDALRFVAPVRSGKRVRGRFVLKDLKERSVGQWCFVFHVVVEIEGESKPALVAEWIYLNIL